MQTTKIASTLGMLLLHAACILATGASASAEETRIGDIVISDAWSRATPNGAKVGVGYVRLTNTGTEGDRLIGLSSDAAAHTEVHEMIMKDGVMNMRAVPLGITLDPGETVELKPGSTHIMFLDLTRPLKQGQPLTAQFLFEHAGGGTVRFEVESVGAQSSRGR